MQDSPYPYLFLSARGLVKDNLSDEQLSTDL